MTNLRCEVQTVYADKSPMSSQPISPEAAHAKALMDAERLEVMLAQASARDALEILLTCHPDAIAILMAFRSLQRQFGYHICAQDLEALVSEKTGPSTSEDPRR